MLPIRVEAVALGSLQVVQKNIDGPTPDKQHWALKAKVAAFRKHL